MRSKHVLAVLLLCGVTAAPVLADDYNPPPWRGLPGTTYARWEFGTDNQYPPPDEWYGPSYAPEMYVEPYGAGWYPYYLGRYGVWLLSGDIWVDIPNYPDPNEDKYIWVQLTWSPWETGAVPMVEEILTPGGPHLGTLIDQRDAPPDWTYSTFLIDLHPNPDFETVHIWGDVYVDEVVIDTICIPEPGSLSLLLLAGCVASLRRR
jgi:hypothetical protein